MHFSIKHLFILCLCLRPPCVHATEEMQKVLSTTGVITGGRTITFERVEPPKDVTMTAVATTATPAVPPMQRAIVLSLSTTVHDHSATDVRWSFNSGDYRAWSTIDFNHLRSVSKFVQDGVTYSLMFGIGNQAGFDELLPAELNAKKAAASYVVVSAPEKADAAAYAGLDALHRYYDAHKAELIAAWEQSEADRIAHEQWQKEHPPVPKDMVIKFWPKQVSGTSDAGNLNQAKGAR